MNLKPEQIPDEAAQVALEKYYTMAGVDTKSCIQYMKEALAAALPVLLGEPVDGWRPIETAPVGKTMILVIGVARDDGKPYVSDPYCVWQPSPGKFTRWPHDFFGPTHWRPIPEPPSAKPHTLPTQDTPNADQ